MELQDLLLPQLTHFSLGNPFSFQGIGKHQLPSLRHFAWWGDEAVDAGIIATIQNFDNQLDSLGFPLASLPRFRRKLRDFPLTRILLDVYPGSDNEFGIRGYIKSQVEVVHLRIHSDIFSSDWVTAESLSDQPDHAQGERKDLQHLINIIRDTPSSPLRSVYIRANLEWETRQITEEARRAKADLIRICHNRDITLVHETQPETGWYSLISADFTRRMSARR